MVKVLLRDQHRKALMASPGSSDTRRSTRASIREENERAILAAAETVFAEHGFEGATTSRIARLAGIPKANLHYYFPTKEALYRRVVGRILHIWLGAADSFDACDSPVEALTRYIHAKMDLSRTHPMASKVWANEMIRCAPMIQDFLEDELTVWTDSRKAILLRWQEEGRIARVNPAYLLYMIWATTQHYADFGHQVATLNGGQQLSDAQFEQAKADVTAIILRGIGAIE
jgi:TetR/AcrR family transcriptional regulator